MVRILLECILVFCKENLCHLAIELSYNSFFGQIYSKLSYFRQLQSKLSRVAYIVLKTILEKLDCCKSEDVENQASSKYNWIL